MEGYSRMLLLLLTIDYGSTVPTPLDELTFNINIKERGNYTGNENLGNRLENGNENVGENNGNNNIGENNKNNNGPGKGYGFKYRKDDGGKKGSWKGEYGGYGKRNWKGKYGGHGKGYGSGKVNTDVFTCYMENTIWRSGIDIENNTQPTAQQCQLSCCRSINCIDWTYHRSSRRCALQGYIKNTNFISGRKNCPLPSSVAGYGRYGLSVSGVWLFEECVGLSARGYCYQDSVIWGDRENTAFEVNTQPTVQDCQKSCANTRLCKVWTYKKSTNRCFLKDPSRIGDIGFISGHKNCALDL